MLVAHCPRPEREKPIRKGSMVMEWCSYSLEAQHFPDTNAMNATFLLPLSETSAIQLRVDEVRMAKLQSSRVTSKCRHVFCTCTPYTNVRYIMRKLQPLCVLVPLNNDVKGRIFVQYDACSQSQTVLGITYDSGAFGWH
jgi:hypothetical protein